MSVGYGEIGGMAWSGGADARPYLSPSPSSLGTWDGLACPGERVGWGGGFQV